MPHPPKPLGKTTWPTLPLDIDAPERTAADCHCPIDVPETPELYLHQAHWAAGCRCPLGCPGCPAPLNASALYFTRVRLTGGHCYLRKPRVRTDPLQGSLQDIVTELALPELAITESPASVADGGDCRMCLGQASEARSVLMLAGQDPYLEGRLDAGEWIPLENGILNWNSEQAPAYLKGYTDRVAERVARQNGGGGFRFENQWSYGECTCAPDAA